MKGYGNVSKKIGLWYLFLALHSYKGCSTFLVLLEAVALFHLQQPLLIRKKSIYKYCPE